MPKVRTQIVPVGTHYPPGLGGKPFEVTPDRAKRWVQQFQQLKAEGVRFPVSWGHNKKANPDDTAFFASKYNAGYVEDLAFDPTFTKPDGEVLPSLVGVLDVPGAETDANNNLLCNAELPGVGRVKTAIGEVSGAFDRWKDGRNRTWDDLLVHVALTPLPVVAGQNGFQPIKEEPPPSQARISMATLATGDTMPPPEEVTTTTTEEETPETPPATPPETPPAEAPAGGEDMTAVIEEIRSLLESHYGIKVPDGETDPTAFLQSLQVALGAAKHARDHASTYGAPSGTPESPTAPINEESHTVTMSTAAAAKDASPLLKALVLEKETNFRNGLLARISNLRKRGLSKKRADEMEQAVTRVQLSINPDGTMPITRLEEVIKVLEEELPKPEYTRAALSTATEQKQPEFGEGKMSNERVDEVADRLMKHIPTESVSKDPTKIRR